MEEFKKEIKKIAYIGTGGFHRAILSSKLADDSHNFWEGCKKVSAGCRGCYAERLFTRWGKDFSVVRRTKGFFAPLKWGGARLIFTCSTSDFFIEQADGWRAEAWAVIKATPQHTWIILTKRPERIKQSLPPDWGPGGYNYPNVRLLVSVEEPKELKRVEILINDVPAMVKGISFEPLIKPIAPELIRPYFEWHAIAYGVPDNAQISTEKIPFINWAIIGGESGFTSGPYKYRPCEVKWIEDIAFTALEYGVPVFVKQFGGDLAARLKLKDFSGGDMAEWPEDLQLHLQPDDKKITDLHRKYIDMPTLTVAGEPAVINGADIQPGLFNHIYETAPLKV